MFRKKGLRALQNAYVPPLCLHGKEITYIPEGVESWGEVLGTDPISTEISKFIAIETMNVSGARRSRKSR